MPVSTPAPARPARRHAAERHDQREDDRQQPDRGRPEERAPHPDRNHRDDVIRSEDRVRKPLGTPPAMPSPVCAERRPRGSIRAAARANPARPWAVRRNRGPSRCSPLRPGFRGQRDRARALYEPERGERADRVGRQRGSPGRPDHLEAAEGPGEGQARATNNSWPASTPRLKNKSACGISAAGSPTWPSALAKPRPCSRPKAEGDSQGCRWSGRSAPGGRAGSRRRGRRC